MNYSTQIHCPQCGKRYLAPPSLIGKTILCKACGANFTVASDADREPPLAESWEANDDRFGHSAMEPTKTAAPANYTAPMAYSGGGREGTRADVIDYEIFGHETQYVEITLDPGEQAIAEAGGR